jgi:hypothetical protein
MQKPMAFRLCIILAIGDDSLSGNLGIGLMLINELRQFMRLMILPVVVLTAVSFLL